MTNAVFTALPMFFMCSLVLPKEVIKQIDKYRKACLWRGSDDLPKLPGQWFVHPGVMGVWELLILKSKTRPLSSRIVINVLIEKICLGPTLFGKSITEMESYQITLKKDLFGGGIF